MSTCWGIRQNHLIGYLSPGTEFLGGRIGSTVSGVEAHMTIPSDKIPLILAGFRLHITTTDRLRISSTGTNFTKPDIFFKNREIYQNLQKKTIISHTTKLYFLLIISFKTRIIFEITIKSTNQR